MGDTTNQQAARYRRQARDAQAQAQQLATLLQALRQDVIYQAVLNQPIPLPDGSTGVLNPDALDFVDLDTDSFFNDEGHLNTRDLIAALTEQATIHPFLFKPTTPTPGQVH